MHNTTGVAVLATHLAATDRRTLSQAWYTALHLAERVPPTVRGAGRSGATREAVGVRAEPSRPAAHGAVAAGPRSARGAAPAPAPPVFGPAERRAAATPVRALERGIAHHARRGGGTFAVRLAGGRVHVLVRTDGGRTRVVAICAAPLRARVERALAQARFVLAGRGLHVETA